MATHQYYVTVPSGKESRVRVLMKVTTGAPNIQNNTTAVTVTLSLMKLDGYTTTGTFSGKIIIDGTSKSFSKKRTWDSDYQSIASASRTVSHGNDGSKNLVVSTKFSNTGTSCSGTYSKSVTIPLTQIPRASDSLSVDINNIEDGFTGVIDKKSDTFTDVLRIYHGDTLIGEIANFDANTLYSFSNDELLKMYNLFDDNGTGNLTFTTSTYNGNSYIGSCTYSCTAMIGGTSYVKTNGSFEKAVPWVRCSDGVWRRTLSWVNIDSNIWKRGV